MKTLARRHDPLAQPVHQLAVLNSLPLPKFAERSPLRASSLTVLQINLGKMCNQTCRHCHVDAGPDRTEIMSRETMEQCLRAIDQSTIQIVDLTGGAPEMNPNFRWFVGEISRRGRQTIVRCNLTILLAGNAYADLPDFFAEHRVHVVSSLPHYDKSRTDRQRGVGVYDKSIVALQKLNAVGYGRPGTDLKLDLVYNPSGAFLPGPQKGLEADFKRELREHFGIEFNELLALTNLPVSRFLEFLVESKNLEPYLTKLVAAYNAGAAESVMCRSLISVGWDGKLYDCDFNQMLEMGIEEGPTHIAEFDGAKLKHRTIAVNQHCFGCTAGAGSSCGGQTT